MDVWILISFGIVSALCIFSVVKLFTKKKKVFANSALSTYLFYTVIFLALWVFNIKVPPYQLLLTMLTVLGACFLGHYLECYTKSKTFDRYLHAFGSFSFSLLTYSILNHFIVTGGSLLFRALFIFLIGNTLGVFFELVEMHHDKKIKLKNVKSQKGLKDTDTDMLFNLFGSVLAAVFAYFWLLQ